jgi:alanyl-tRNA synthetase
MESNEIRRRFRDFFVARDHTPVPSASLIPVDPTMLLTSAGMVPFKPYFLGEEEPPYPRATSIQKCARTSDIDIVGTTARHATFFEMLGNFSFGDYFKAEAIPWAYEFVTQQLGLDPEDLWYTVHETDDEACQIWIDAVGVPADRVQRGGKDNFWQMGVPGPCGPSSEIFVDRGARFGEGGGPIGGDEDRFVEVWNLVFMQHVQDVPYHVVGDLPSRNIDTGAGLERIAAVLQGVDSLFEVDTVRPVIARAEGVTGTTYGAHAPADISLRILGDHGRAVAFLIADGVVPSNEGRGYVLRRLIRRAVRHAWQLGGSDLVMPALAETTIDLMGDEYTELRDRRDFVLELTEREEVRFRRTLESGHSLLAAELDAAAGEDILSGETAFRLHDTYGFPIELTEEIAREQGLAVDRGEFDTHMQAQRERARAAWKGSDAAGTADAYRRLLDGIDSTEFIGYADLQGSSVILSVIHDGAVVDQAGEGQDVEVFLDRSPFYAEAGGQVGDTGTIETGTGTVRVGDTQGVLPGVRGHRGKVVRGTVHTGQEAKTEIDAARRERIAKAHTGTHLLHWALREILGTHAHQAGSLVEDGRLRFDFSHYAAMSSEEIAEVEGLVNERVIENADVFDFTTTKDEALALGALAFFGDKYGDEVRVVQAGEYSKELCGGTHVRTTGQVGPLLLTSEGSIGSNIRRVEALTGSAAYGLITDLRTEISAAAATLRTQPGRLVAAADALVTRTKEQEARLGEFAERARRDTVAALLEQVEYRDDHAVLAADAGEVGPDDLRLLALQLRERLASVAGVLGSAPGGKAALVAFVSDDLVDKGISAGEIVNLAARIVGGGGSKNPSLAQAGGPRGDAVAEALAEAGRALREAIAGL